MFHLKGTCTEKNMEGRHCWSPPKNVSCLAIMLTLWLHLSAEWLIQIKISRDLPAISIYLLQYGDPQAASIFRTWSRSAMVASINLPWQEFSKLTLLKCGNSSANQNSAPVQQHFWLVVIIDCAYQCLMELFHFICCHYSSSVTFWPVTWCYHLPSPMSSSPPA